MLGRLEASALFQCLGWPEDLASFQRFRRASLRSFAHAVLLLGTVAAERARVSAWGLAQRLPKQTQASSKPKSNATFDTWVA